MGLIGKNLYKMAARVVGKQAYELFASTGAARDARGFQAPMFAVGVALRDSIQAVPQNIYVYLGLDLAKQYIMIYTDSLLVLPSRSTQGSQVGFDGDRYQIQSGSDWRAIDGWQGVLCVKLQTTGTV